MVDRPLGPRSPDKRNEAYESIFGRPSATHHQGAPLQPPFYPQSVHQQQVDQPYHYPQQYQTTADKRSINSPPYNGSALPQQYQNHSHPGPYQQSYHASHSSQSHIPHQGYPTYAQPPYGYSHSLAPPSVYSVARSANGVPYTSNIPPQQDEPPDASLEALTRKGLTPAQAYQAQVYMNNPTGPQGPRHRHTNSIESSSNRQSHGGNSGKAPEPPRLGLTIEQDDGSLGIDFISPGGSGSDHGEDDGSSELPWARKDRSRASPSFYQIPVMGRLLTGFWLSPLR
jgi:hypothetical protein